MQKENSTLGRKVALRISLLKRLPASPVILETHGGKGRVFERTYPHVKQGIVFELDQSKTELLARQRPTWAVYQGKSEASLEVGIGAHLLVNFLDVDPFGECWPTLDAFFNSERPRADVLAVAVNDGLRQKLRLQAGWHVRSMRQAIEKWGNAGIFERYLQVCEWKLQQIAARQQYALTHWTGYYCGDQGDMTHFGAILERKKKPAPKARRRTSTRKTAQAARAKKVG